MFHSEEGKIIYRYTYNYSIFPPTHTSPCVIISNSILRQHLPANRHKLRSDITSPPHKPKPSYEKRQPPRDQTCIIHRLRRHGQREREAENNDKRHDVQHGCRIHDIPNRALHPEPAGRDVRTAAKQVRQDGGEVGEGGENDVGADEGVEGGGGADVDAAHDGADDAAEGDGVERVLESRMHAAEELGRGGRVVAGERPESAGCGDVAADGGAEGGQEGEDEQADGAAGGAGGLAVDFGDGEGRARGEDGIEVVNGIEDGDEVEEAGPEADNHLREDCFGDVFAGVRDFFRQMRYSVWGADGVGTIEHTSDKHEAVARVAGLVRPVVPDKGIGGVSRAIFGGHDGTYDNGDEDTGDDEEAPQDFDFRQRTVGEEDGSAADPAAEEVGDKDMPGVGLEIGVEGGVHGDNLVTEDGGDGGGAEDPGEEVPPAGEKAAGTTVFSSCYGGPVVY